ncbi:MAG: tryptophan halogenase, partial [Sphingomonas sp.]
FPDRDCDPALAARFNTTFARDMDGIKDFLILHYHATGRDEPLWRHCQTMRLPDGLHERIGQYRRSGRLILDADELFREASWLAVLDGQGIRAQSYNPLADAIDPAANRAQVQQIADVIARAAPTLPTHDAVLAQMIGTPS